MPRSINRLVAGLSVLGLAVGIVMNGYAQEYPSKPIRLLVSSAPVGSNDIFARLAAAKLTEALHQQVLVDNRAGASGMTAVQFVAKSPPDGYTLLLGNLSTLAVNLSLFKSVPYDPIKDFQPMTLIAKLPQILVVHPSLSVRTVKQLIALAKAKPGALNYGSGLSGSGAHLSAELFKWMAKVDIVMVPYKSGVGGALSELAGGQISMVFGGVPGAAPFIQSGRLRALGITGKKRVRAFPEVPTIDEAGLPGYELTLWYGLLAPTGTPASVVSKINATLAQALQTPEMEERFEGMGAQVAISSPTEFAGLIKSEIQKWATVVKAAGITAE